MIIKSQISRKVGELVTDGGINDHEGIPHFLPFVVMEVVTKEDYLIECAETNHSVGIIFSNDNFYRVSID